MDRFLRAVGRGGRTGGRTCIEDGGGEGICPESQRGIYAIVQYYPAHVTKADRVGQTREPLVRRETDERDEKRKQEMERGKKHKVARGCKQMTRCDRQGKQVNKK